MKLDKNKIRRKIRRRRNGREKSLARSFVR